MIDVPTGHTGHTHTHTHTLSHTHDVMNDLNMTNTILDTFSVKYYFPHFTFLFNCSLQNQEQQIGGFATVQLSNLNKVIVSINTRTELFKHCKMYHLKGKINIYIYIYIYIFILYSHFFY